METALQIKTEARSYDNDTQSLSTFSPLSTSSHHNVDPAEYASNYHYHSLQSQHQLLNSFHHIQQLKQQMQLQHQASQNQTNGAKSATAAATNTSTNSNNSKIRKRSANQAYEFLIRLDDSKAFQDWLVKNETDFTWVHKRNSMTNAGKKYYYICNYRIKKGFTRCPAVIYALFPNNDDTKVMVYSCGEHDHKRANGTAAGNGAACPSSKRRHNHHASSLNLNTAPNANNNDTSLDESNYQNDSEMPGDDCPTTNQQSIKEEYDDDVDDVNDEMNDDDEAGHPTTAPVTDPIGSIMPFSNPFAKNFLASHLDAADKLKYLEMMKLKHQHGGTGTAGTGMNPLRDYLLAINQVSLGHNPYQGAMVHHGTGTGGAMATVPYHLNSASSIPSSSSSASSNSASPLADSPPPPPASSSTGAHFAQPQSTHKANMSAPSMLTSSSSSASSSSSSSSSLSFGTHNQTSPVSPKGLKRPIEDTNQPHSTTNGTARTHKDAPVAKLMRKDAGMPRAAALTLDNAPVHIDVGGSIFTSSLETLTRHPESKLSKMFNGSEAIVLDTLKQHYFIDRDGKLFRHILNFMRTSRLTLPENFDEFETLIDEAKFYELHELVKQIEIYVKEKLAAKNAALGAASASVSNTSSNASTRPLGKDNKAKKSLNSLINGIYSKLNASGVNGSGAEVSGEANAAVSSESAETGTKCSILIVREDSGAVSISGEMSVIRELFGSDVAESACKYATRLNLGEQRHLVEVMERLYEKGFRLESSSTPANEYVFVRHK